MRTQRAIITSLIAFSVLFIKYVTNFIIIRLFIKTFGNEMNGLVAIARQILEYLNILDGGVGIAVITMLFSPLAEKDYERANRIITAANQYYRKIGLIFYFSLFTLAYIYSFLLDHSIDSQIVFWIIILTGAMYLSNFFIVPGFNFLLIADQREYIANLFSMVANIFGPIVMILLMNMEYNVYIVRFIPVIMNLFVGVCIRFYVFYKYKWVNIHGKLNANNILKNQAKNMLYHKIAGLIVFNTDMIVLSIVTGFAEVSIYSIYLSIYYLAKNIMAPIIASGRIGIGQILAEGKLSKVRKVFSTYEYISYLIVFIFLTTLSIVTIPFIRIYVDGLNGLQYSNIKLNVLFSIMFLMDLVRNPHKAVITVAGHFKQTKYRALAEALLNIIFSLWLVHLYGIYGVLYGTIIAYSYRVIDILLYASKKILKISIKKTVLRISVNLAVAVALYFIGNYTFPNVNHFFEWLLYAGIYFIFIAVVFSGINFAVDSTPFKDFLHRIDLRRLRVEK